MDQNLKKLPQSKQQQSHHLSTKDTSAIKLGSSSEELTPEEKYILRSGKRQEPQGEELPGYAASCNAKVACKNISPVPKSAPKSQQQEPNKELQQFVAMIKSGPGKQGSSATGSGNGPANTSRPQDIDNHDRTSPSSSESSRGQRESVTPTSSDEDGNASAQNRKVQRTERQYRAAPNSSAERHKSKNSPSHSKSKNMSLDSTNSGQSAYNTLIIHHNNSSLLADTWLPANHEFTSIGIGGKTNSPGNAENNNDASLSPFSNSRNSVSPSMADSYSQQQSQYQLKNGNRSGAHYSQMSPNNLYENIDYQAGGTSSELSDIPRDYLDQLTVLKHLAKDLQQEPAGSHSSNLKRSESFSRSQPDLTQQRQYNIYTNQELLKPQPQQASGNVSLNTNWQQPRQGSGGEEVLPSVQILEILMRENSNLKAELVNYRRKAGTINKVRLMQLEAEVARLQASHAALFESAERRESLERSARVKLSSELKRLTAVNRELLSSSGSLQNLAPYTGNLPVDIEALKKEIAKKDLMIAQLVSQNKELVAIKERQEIELNAQSATLAEQRTHIDILDGALTNAQNNALRLEEECRKKQEYVDKVSQLQRAMSTLQLSSDKREQSEKKMRSQLEGEINDLKSRLVTLNDNPVSNVTSPRSTPAPQAQAQPARMYQSPPPYPGTQATQHQQNTPNPNSAKSNDKNLKDTPLQQLQEQLKASEEQIYHLNSQVAKWENVFSAPDFPKQGQADVSTTQSYTQSPPRDLGAGAAGGGNDELKWKVKELESRLNEKDAVIRILQAGPNNISSPMRQSPIHFSSLNSSNSSSVPAMAYTNAAPPSYRDSPGYQQAGGAMPGFAPVQGMSKHHAREASGSMGSGLDRRSPSVPGTSASSMYMKMGLIQQQLKSDSEPPCYANISPKVRLGGSGSSLMKTSSESLQHVLGHSSVGSGNSPAGSISGASGVSATGQQNEGRSIDDQLRELDTQLLSKGAPGTLKMHSGLCCIPNLGFPHSAAYKSQKTIPKSLLESLSAPYHLASVSNSKHPLSLMGLNMMPPKPPSTYYTQNHGSGGSSQVRTNSGPPFMTSASTAFVPLTPSGRTTAGPLSNSVDSVLNDGNPSAMRTKPPAGPSGGGGNVFTPIPRGLPPKSPTNVFDSSSGGKSRSLERNKASSGSSDPSAGKYTVFMYDAARCRSLDRNIKATTNSAKESKKSEKESSKGNLKSSVSSKAAFFGQLLTRRSPSPGRDKKYKDKDCEKEKNSQGAKFTFSGGGKSTPSTVANTSLQNQPSEAEVDAMLLDRQGRTSQNSRNRISSKWSSSNTLESVEEQSGSESPWVQRKCDKKSSGNSERAKSVPSPDPKQKQENNATTGSNVSSSNMDAGLSTPSSGKKWGRIVKTPFGLRYAFGSPRVAATGAESDSSPRK